VRGSHEKPEWAGTAGPGYEFDEDGDLLWFASASVTGYRPKPEEDSE